MPFKPNPEWGWTKLTITNYVAPDAGDLSQAIHRLVELEAFRAECLARGGTEALASRIAMDALRKAGGR
jgi:hypothetical protein